MQVVKIAEDFKKAAVEKGIKRVPIHECSFCGYPCGYVIQGERVYYDSGCDCTGGDGWRDTDWNDIAESYNMNQRVNNPNISEEWLKKTDEFWGFNQTNHAKD